MRIYEGSPRQHWENALRSIGAYVDRELLKEILLLDLEDRFLLQGLALPAGGSWSETMVLHRTTIELDDDAVGRLIDEAEARRGTGDADPPQVAAGKFYEQALRVIGRYVEGQRPRDLLLFDQEGSFVLRMLVTGQGGGSVHQLAEFTRDEILAMIDAGPEQRGKAAEESGA